MTLQHTSVPTTCIVCRQPFQPATREHILPNAVGWTTATSHVVCPDCNCATTSYDKAIADSFSLVTTWLDPPGRRVRTPASSGMTASISARFLDDDAGEPSRSFTPRERLRVEPGGQFTTPGVFSVPSSGSDRETIFWDTEEDRDAWLRKLESRGNRPKLVRNGAARLRVTTELQLYAVQATALPGLGKSALHFARLKIEDWDGSGQGADTIRTALASGQAPGAAGSTADYDLPDLSSSPFYHGLQVIACPRTGCLAVRVHVYGLVRARFVLSDHYAGSSHVIQTCVETPRDRGKEERTESCYHPLPWLMERTSLRDTDFGERSSLYFRAHSDALPLPPIEGGDDLAQFATG